MTAALLLALSLLAADELVVPSSSDRFAAVLRRAPGAEERPPHTARWSVSLREEPRGEEPPRERWSALVPPEARTGLHLVPDDGRTFVQLSPEYSQGRAVVRIWRDGRRLASLSGSAFRLPHESVRRTSSGRRWLDGGFPPLARWIETARGPVMHLELVCTDGRVRRVDLERGALVEREPGAAYVEPAIERERTRPLQVPHVESVEAPAVIGAGEPLEVWVRGQYPTPGHTILGFVLEQERSTLTLVPFSRPPGGDPVPPVFQRFRTCATIRGLLPGRYRVRGAGPDGPAGRAAVVDVRPERQVVSLERTGGIAGWSHRVRVFEHQVVAIDRGRDAPTEYRHVRDETLDVVERLVRRLPDGERTTPGAMDAFVYELRWSRRDERLALTVDDGTRRGVAGELIELLLGLE